MVEMAEKAVFPVGLVVVSYLCGSLPFGYWITRLVKGKHFDIRDWGSGNIGFANVKRVLGWKVSLPVLVADTFKAFLPVLVAKLYLGEPWGIVCLIAAGIGHAWSLYFFIAEGKFGGGKSVATLFGGILALQPALALAVLCFFLVVLVVFQYLSLASITASVFALFFSFLLRLGAVWNLALMVIMLMLLYTHRRNIGRLIQGTEPKFNEKRGAHDSGEEAVVAFVVHPLDFSDFSQSRLSCWIPKLMSKRILSERTVNRLLAKGAVMESGEIAGIETCDGQKARVLIFGIFLLPAQIMDPANKSLVDRLLQSAVVLAQRRGATVIGLGALLSSAAKGGSELQKWARQRGLRIVVDNGAAFTAGATIEALESEKKKPLACLRIANIGASGLIGYAIIRYLEGKAKEVMAFARDKKKLKGFNGLTGLFGAEEISALEQADVIICNTSSPFPILTTDNSNLIKSKTLVLDVAVPPDFDDEIRKTRPDIKLIRCGLILMPGDISTQIDFHFGDIVFGGKERPLVPACLAQTVILGITREYQHASRGAKVLSDDLDFFRRQAEKLGFRIVGSQISEPTLFRNINTSPPCGGVVRDNGSVSGFLGQYLGP